MCGCASVLFNVSCGNYINIIYIIQYVCSCMLHAYIHTHIQRLRIKDKQTDGLTRRTDREINTGRHVQRHSAFPKLGSFSIWALFFKGDVPCSRPKKGTLLLRTTHKVSASQLLSFSGFRV